MAAATDEVTPGPLLLQSKLQRPAQRELVWRSELVDRLAGGPQRRLTVLSAPAGWGKTTLLGAWAGSDREKRPFAWLSLDARDAEGGRFWTYVVAALRALQPQLGLAALELLTAPGVDMEREALPVLLNELESLPGPSVLALDDYHLIESPEIHAQMSYIVGAWLYRAAFRSTKPSSNPSRPVSTRWTGGRLQRDGALFVRA